MKALGKKLVRDMRQSAMQLLALVMLCVLGTFLFAALDGTAGMIELTNDTFFRENNLADLWISLPSADRDALERVRSVRGVASAEARFSLDMQTTLPAEPLLNVTGYDGPMDINRPLICEGAALAPGDRRGCLIQVGFADAHGLDVNDSIVVKYGSAEYTFFIRGTVYSPEYISVSSGDSSSDPNHYGFMLVNARAMAQVPLTQIVAKLAENADEGVAERAIRSLLPRALIVDRASHASTVTATDNVQMFRSVARVFPVAAFMLAALIVMVTITRMIENERTQIGTLKSLGYSQRRIRRHFLAYAAWPSLIGAALGAVAGHLTLPGWVWEVMMSQYAYPYRLYPAISWVAWLLVAFTVVMSVVICLMTYRRITRETTASLLRAKAPKRGARLFLERFPRLWGRLRFNSKMIVRNIMRNKLRTFISFVGILCCNALLIASLGLQDSVTLTADNYYDRTLNYDVLVSLSGPVDEAAAYRERIDAERVECIMESAVRVFTDAEERVTALTVIEDDQRLLALGPNEKHVQLPDGAAAITQKLSQTLDLALGDALPVQLPGDDEVISIPIGQIVHNNFSQGIYLTASTWEGLRKGAFAPTAIELKAPSEAALFKLTDMDEVEKIETTAERKAEMLKNLVIVTYAFVILLAVALALAFVICYNMGLINFAERLREYATLKVLGYHKREIRKLIIDENTLIAVPAVLLSIWPGIGFTGIILRVVETDSFLYTSTVSVASIAISCAISLLFSYVIQGFLVRKVQKIDMVDALKSIE